MPELRLLLPAVILCLVLVAGGQGLEAAASADGGSRPVLSAVPLPGDPVPAVRISEWLQEGVYDQVRPVGGRTITVIEFWASWDPLSRAILPGHDARQAEVRKQGVRFLTIAEEQPQDTQAYLRQAKIRSLAVASDPEGEAMRAVLGTDTELPCPFAMIVEERVPARERKLLWLGPVVNDADSWARCSGYQGDLDTALAEVLAGTLDVAAARAAEVRRRDFYELAAEAQTNALAGDFEKAVPLARQMQARAWPPELARMQQDAFTNVAFFLAEDAWSPVWGAATSGQALPLETCLRLLDDPSRKARAELALALATTARELAGTDDAVLLHVYARAQAALGDVKGALATQRRAVQAPRPHGQLLQMAWISETQLSLAAYLYERILDGTPIYDYPERQDPPATLTAAQALADLHQLDNLVRRYHPGYDDAAWELAGAGSSWDEHTENFAKRLESQPIWSSSQFWRLLSDEYLAAIADRHTVVALHGETEAGQAYTNVCYPTMSQQPFFAEVRVREAGGKLTISEAPDDLKSWLGAEVVGVPIISSPTAAEPRRAYLFPTLPHGKAKEYLVGMLAEPLLHDPPKTVTVNLRTAAGERPAALPLHRGRAGLERQQRAPWTLREGPVPVLEVRTMDEGQLTGLVATADAVRKAPLVVLDLRGNGGGSDIPAIEWCARLAGRPVTSAGGFCNLRAGEANPQRHWNSFFGDYWWVRLGEVSVASTREAFDGELVVLADNGTGSAAEGFVKFASRIPATVIVGENTAGCLTYGNQTQTFVLTESKLEVRFGWSKSAFATRPFREGLGYFPDYWLDTEDPVRAIVDYMGRR